MEKLLVLSNFLFCHNFFKMASAEEASTKASICGKGLTFLLIQTVVDPFAKEEEHMHCWKGEISQYERLYFFNNVLILY